MTKAERYQMNKAITDFKKAYEKAVVNSYIRKPVANALYTTWRNWDSKETSRITIDDLMDEVEEDE